MTSYGPPPNGLPLGPPPPGPPPAGAPLLGPPPGPPSESHGWTMVILSLVLGVCCILIIGIRMWQRAMVQRNTDTSDWLALAALPPTLLYLLAAALAEKAFHLNRNLTWQELEAVAKFRFAATIIAYGSSALVRLSILFLYRRVSRHHPRKIFDRAVWIAVTVVLIAMLANILGQVFNCRPVNAFWKSANPEYMRTHEPSCNDMTAYTLATSCVSLTLDLAVYLMPIALLWNLRLPTRQKVALWVLFLLGLLAVVAAAIRIYFCAVGIESHSFATGYWITLWTSMELSCATIAASAPSLRVFFSAFFESSDTATDSQATTDSRQSIATSQKSRRKSWWQGAAAKRRKEQDPTTADDNETIEILRALRRLDLESGSFGSRGDTKEEEETIEEDVEWKPTMNMEMWNEKEEEEMERLFKAARRLAKE